jgi:tetratricopeptide (TPR) repeat protein
MRFEACDTFTDWSKGVLETGNQGKGRLFAAAAVLARKGRYAEATKLLERARDANECSDAQALDLQARIYAQQGLYLYAESCWSKAKTVDGSNPAYDEALDRLRRARPLTGRLYQVTASLCVLAVFGLLVWQVAFVHPRMHSRQNVTESSLAALRSAIATFQSSSQSREQELALRVAGVDSTMRELETRLVKQLNAMPTAAQMTEDHNTIIDRIEAAVAQVSKAIAALESNLNQRVETVESVVSRRVDTIDAGIRRDMQSLATSSEVTQLGQSISNLQEQLAQLAAAVQELKRAEGDSTANTGEPGKGP